MEVSLNELSQKWVWHAKKMQYAHAHKLNPPPPPPSQKV